MQFAPLSPVEIEAYVATGEPLQCAGGFALEGRGGALVERIEGCFFECDRVESAAAAVLASGVGPSPSVACG